MALSIKRFSTFQIVDLYELFKDIFSSSNDMSESLADKYPDLDSFQKDLDALAGLPGAVAIAIEIEDKPVPT